MATFIKEVKPSLAKPLLNFNVGLAKRGLTSFVKCPLLLTSSCHGGIVQCCLPLRALSNVDHSAWCHEFTVNWHATEAISDLHAIAIVVHDHTHWACAQFVGAVGFRKHAGGLSTHIGAGSVHGIAARVDFLTCHALLWIGATWDSEWVGREWVGEWISWRKWVSE